MGLPFATSVLFAGSYIAAKYTTADLGPLTTTLLRYIVALAFLACLIPLQRSGSLRVPRREVPRLAMLGLFGIVGYHFFFFTSLRYTEVANTAIINALSPVITGVMAAIFIKERLAPKNYLGVAVAVTGVMVLLARGDISNLVALRLNAGDLLMLLSVISWAIYALLVKHMIKAYEGFTLTLYGTLCGVVLLIALGLIEGPVTQLRTVSVASIVAVLYMGIFASGLGYLLYNFSIREIGPTRTAGFVYSVVPILVAALALVFFGQGVSGFTILSTFLIVAGLTLILSGRPIVSIGNQADSIALTNDVSLR